ncbi:MAG: GTP pyrophosphokinase family protein [Oscillospiraceae bacterium]|jgi:putative GTP pyrophosphokinase|nr:GTP pyrophosphokinase family protein [Oscillospiraceae bacterium]
MHTNENWETLFSNLSDEPFSGLSSDLITATSPLLHSIVDQSKKVMGDMVEFKELMMMYTCAMKEIKTKFDVLNTEYNVRYQRNPIKFIGTRLKRPTSIAEKITRKGLDFTLGNIEERINDVAGVRVICSYVDDIYVIAKALTQQDDIELVAQKDYIAFPKNNGYRSLHLIVSIPVFFANQTKRLKVEVQIRTIAMDFWASLEHQLKYKSDSANDPALVSELRDCAERIASTDARMLGIRQRLEANQIAPSEDAILWEKLRRIDVPIE